MSYFNNHNHSDYSNTSLGFPDVVNKISELIQRGYDIGLSGLTLTDHESLSGCIEALTYYEKMQKDRPFTLALGNEIYLMEEQEDISNKEGDSKTPYYHFVLTALDTEGYKQLCQLSTCAWLRAYKKNIWRRPTYYSDLEEIIKPNQGHVIASTACLGSRIDRLLLEEESDETRASKVSQELDRLFDIFGRGNVYLEVQPAKEEGNDQSIVNRRMVECFKYREHPIRIIPTTDSHYLSKDTAFIHKVYLNSQDGDREVDDFYATAYLMDEDELRDYLRIDFTDELIDQMYKWSDEIRQRVKGYDIKHNPIIPQLPENKIPPFVIQHSFKDYYSKYSNFKWYSQSSAIHEQYFFYQIEQGLKNKVVSKGKNLESYIARLDIEWNELHKISDALNTSMVSYYSTMSVMIELMWEVGSIVGPGRGSAAGFLTTYILDITQIDPLPLGEYMPYWRHVALERGAELADIDVDSEPAYKYAIINKMKEYFGEDKVLNVATFSKISSKTAIERACKGLNIADDTAAYLKSLIPVNRGKVSSLKDCIYGDKDKGIAPVYELVNELNAYPNLKESALGLEGLLTNRSIHAAGLVVCNEPYTNYLAAMRSPEGTLTTCYNLWDSEAVSCVKFDLLTVTALQKIHKAMDELIKYGKIEWQGNVKATYDKYLHPDIINYDNQDMWQKIPNVYSIFQFDTPISTKALATTEPKSVMDLSAANSLLRLMPDNADETPMERYTRYKQSHEAWIEDTKNYGLNDAEKECLWEYLSDAYGLADSQEKIMRLSMDKRVSGYSLKESNALRKSIAKKDERLQAKAKDQFFEYGRRLGTREVFLDYIWNVVFAASMGYSFSQIHSYSYSIIALQELNLFYYYPSVYWNVGCLSTEALGSEEGSGGTVNYGEMAKAIYKMRNHGVEVMPPLVNEADIDFTPIESNNSILFGLGGIAGINPDIAQQVLDNRPYSSFKDFYIKNAYQGSLITPSKFKQFIKAGCFDEFNTNRIHVMKQYILYSTEPVTSLTMANIPMVVKSGASVPKPLMSPYNFYKYATSKQFYYGVHPKFKSKKLYWLDDRSMKYFKKYCQDSLQEGTDYFYENDMTVFVDKSIEKLLKPSLVALKEYVNTPEFLKAYNKKLLLMKYNDFVPNQDIHHWEFEATSYYHNGKHELDGLDKAKYLINDFSSLPEEPRFVEKSWGKKTWKQYEISQIAGTVLDRNDNNHLVTLLTTDNQVVNVKFYAGLFANYKRQNSIVNEEGKKQVIDPSYFSRGQLLIICGYRREENDFVAKRYSKSVYQHTCQRIWKVNEDGSAEIQSERCMEDND